MTLFEVLESMISKYGPDAKVSDVMRSERIIWMNEAAYECPRCGDDCAGECHTKNQGDW